MADPITRYATEADLGLYALSEDVLRDIDPERVEAALEAASREMDGHIANQYSLPLMAIGVDLRKFTAWMAAYILMSSEGFDPENANDQVLADRYTLAVDWAKLVGGGRVQPSGMVGSAVVSGSTTGQAPGARPMMVSSSQRGWSARGEPEKGGGFVGD